jgi:hypothetical protein
MNGRQDVLVNVAELVQEPGRVIFEGRGSVVRLKRFDDCYRLRREIFGLVFESV